MERDRIAALMRDLQDAICTGLENLEDGAHFGRDAWQREGGGGGVTRVLQNGSVIEKGGVNSSEVHGHFPAEFASRMPGSGTAFHATGVSIVIHPLSPHVPTVHGNFRFLELGEVADYEAFRDACDRYFFLPYRGERRGATPVTPEQRRWHEQRRGRYVEFNLLHDRGTVFGLETGGRTESILMSLPPRVQWAYGEEPERGTPEHALLEELRRPRPGP